MTTNGLRGKVDAAIITIRKDEHDAVVSRLAGPRLVKLTRHYTLGSVRTASGRDASVLVHRLSEQGNGPSQSAAHDMIEDLAPHILALVGIGGGVPSSEITLGDVVAATRLADMRVQALRPDQLAELELRGERVHKGLAELLANLSPQAIQGWSEPGAIRVPRPPVPLDVQRFEGSDEWRQKNRAILTRHFSGPKARTRPIFDTGTLASSDSLVRDPATLEHWLQGSRKIQTIDMEAAGVFEAASKVDSTYPVLVVRGTSDIVGYRREADWTAYACHTAASFVMALLRSDLLRSIRPLSSRHVDPPAKAPRPPAANKKPSSTAAQTAPRGAAASTHSVLRLTERLQPVGGARELRIWISEVTENLERQTKPLFRLELGNELATLTELNRLTSRKALTLDERAKRLQLVNKAENYEAQRKMVGRMLLLLFKGCFGRWAPAPHDYATFISQALSQIFGRDVPYDEKVDQLCEISGPLHVLVPLSPAEIEELWRHAGLPAKLFLETDKHLATHLPYRLRTEKILPQILRIWLPNRRKIADVEIEARAIESFRIGRSWFQLRPLRRGG